MEWSNPGPPWRSTTVGLSRMAGPSGTRLEPSTSKKSRTPLTSTRTRSRRPTVEENDPRLDAPDLQQARLAPGIRGEAGPESLLAGRVDDEHDFVARARGPAEHDEAFSRERIHEGGVLGPESLRTHRQGRIPGWSPEAPDDEVRPHVGSILEAQSSSSVMGQWSEPWTWGMMPAALTRPRSSSETKK